MKKKVIGIVGTIITTIIMAVCIIKVGGTFLKMMTISGIILCNKEDKEFIYTISKLKEDFSIIIYEEGTHDNTIVKVIKNSKLGLPSMFGEKIILEDNEKHTDSRLCEYIRRNDNSDYAMFVCIFPYIIIIVISWLIFDKKLITLINNK